ncbi:vacuolar membrane-associated protein iml1 [Coemansia sp. RSA 552]|nr:vacuolar membrane-associated protein iml1 [Coemansia sp. RSA 552]
MPRNYTGERNRVSIFDRRGQKAGGRGRGQAGKTGSAAGYGHHRAGAGEDGGQEAPTLFNKVCMLRVYEETFSTSDLILNQSFFPGISIGDIVAIKPLAEGDDGELLSPRTSLDNGADTGGGEAGSSTKGSTPLPATPSSSKADMTARAEPDAARATDKVDPKERRGSRRPNEQQQLPTQKPQGPHRWTGATESNEDDSESGLRPDPHREILLQVSEVRRDTQPIQALMSSLVARTLWGEYLTNQRVVIRKVDMASREECEAIRADFVEIAFRDQYVGRSDMWRLWRSLSRKVVHNNKPTNMEGLIRASVRRIYKNSKDVPCAFIDSSTQPIFRSESGRFIIFIQMSEEMWVYQEDGHLCFEKTVNSFLAELFRRWRDRQLNHMVTIVMFSRWYYHEQDSLFFQDLIYDEDYGRYYRDYYKVIADMEVRQDWCVFLPEILSEFNTYRRDIQELRTPSGYRLRGDLSKANQGNILEAINLGINSFASNYVDRDLARTGLSTIVVTPSFGVFDVPKKLLRMTTERMLHFGTRVDFVCLAPQPLFCPPVFRFKSCPVPSKQEQNRAVSLRIQALREKKRAKETEMNSVSPLAESPGPHSGTTTTTAPLFAHGTNQAKDRDGVNPFILSDTDFGGVVDPISLDPLYFDDERWENELQPFLTGAGSRDPAVASSLAHHESRRDKRSDNAARPAAVPMASSIVSALVGDCDIDSSEVPDTIKQLQMDSYPFLSHTHPEAMQKNRVVYSYFPYWVDCGFYNYTEQRASHHTGDFSPTCKMGELSVTGVADYMLLRPMIPDLDLKAVENDYAASLAGLDAYTASGTESPDAAKVRSEGCRSADTYTTKDMLHGRGRGADRPSSSAQGQERLLEMFAKYDRQAIVGTGPMYSSSSGGLSSDGIMTGSTPAPPTGLAQTSSGALDSRMALGHAPTPLHLSQPSVMPSNTSAHWSEDHPRGESGSVEPAEHILPAVSSSASPNLRHAQGLKPPTRPDQSGAMSSSVPREVKLGGLHAAPANVYAAFAPQPRTSVFARSSAPPRKGPVQPRQTYEPRRSSDSLSGTEKQSRRLYGPEAAAGPGSRSVTRVSGSPQSLEYGRDSLVSAERASVEPAGVQPQSSERLPVSESIARQSHLDDQIRTFRGYGAQHHSRQDQPSYQIQSPHAASALMRQQTLGNLGGIAPDAEFQLTLPAGRQMASAAPFGAAQPGIPLVADYYSGSPQYAKMAWLNESRASLGHPQSESVNRGMRQQHCGPYNPCNPELYPLPSTELSKRWAYAFPTNSALSSYTPKWRSLCTPASLPLVVDYSPTNLNTYYRHYFYHIKAPDISADDYANLPEEDHNEFAQFMFGSRMQSAPAAPGSGTAAIPSSQPDASRRIDRSARIMLKEMVYQRLAQGYQFISFTDTSGTRITRDHPSWFGYSTGWPKLNSGRSDVSEWHGGRGVADTHGSSGSPHSNLVLPGSVQNLEKSIWLSNGRQVQKLEFHDNSSTAQMPGVLVTRWERNTPFDQSELRYGFQMWSRGNNMGYCSTETRFSYPSEEDVNWNTLDYMITGYQNALTRTMKYWRARYVLIPLDQLGNDTIINTKSSPQMSVEDMRIANFEKFLDHILRLVNKDEKAKLEDRFLGSLPPEMRRSTSLFGSHSSDSQRRGPAQKPGGGTAANSGNQQQAGQQQFPVPPQLAHSVSLHDGRKAIALSDLIPSSLMQIRYTTMYPVPYVMNQLNCYINDTIYLDPSMPISLPPPAASVLGLSDNLNVESPFSQLSHALQHATVGIRLRNIRWHYGYFNATFSGYQMVDWILVNFDSVNRRSQAVAAGNRLMERGIFNSPHRPGSFLDGFYFFEFSEVAIKYKASPHAQHQPASHPQQPASRNHQNTLMSSIGFADMVSRYGSSSNNASPVVSRPESRQGSTAPSVANDMSDPGHVMTPGNTSSATSAVNTPKTSMSGPADPRRPYFSAGDSIATSAVLSTPPESRSAAGGPQPSSKLRVRSDLPSSSPPSPLNTSAPPGARGSDDPASTSSSSASASRRNADAATTPQLEREKQAEAGEGWQSQDQLGTQDATSPTGRRFEYTETPDIFPEAQRAKTRRALPKNLQQSRMFVLNLDQQHKSTRIEHCLVHLDAVHNPLSCFHLSINWLNCTNYLIDELVRSWARMALRCGMRLVEAPRAQDSSVEDTHPFHSPTRVSLELPPPPVERIFDDEWVAEFAFFGDEGTDDVDGDLTAGSDSESGTDSDRATRRRRTLRRMARCIPTYPFERELLEEQDFVLDVEAESSYPGSDLLSRDFTFERVGHKHTQYVHRSGTAFVQICGPGQFLWINNYLYTSHQSNMRTTTTQAQGSATAQNQPGMPATAGKTPHPPPPSLAGGASQMALGTYSGSGGTRSDTSVVGLAGVAASTPEIPPVSTPGGWQLPRLQQTLVTPPSLQPSQAQALATRGLGLGHDPEMYVPIEATVGTQAVVGPPVFYPTRQKQGLWPHQDIKALALNRGIMRRLELSEDYSMQIVNSLGEFPEDFDSVNSAVSRVSGLRLVTNEASESAGGALPIRRARQNSLVAFDDARGSWPVVDDAPDIPVHASQQQAPHHYHHQQGCETNPDVVRATFIEVCRDKNSLEMFWHQTIQRYRAGWRSVRAEQAGSGSGDSLRGKALVADMLTDAMWQVRQHMSPTT